MLKKPWKVIKKDSGKVSIYSNHRERDILYNEEGMPYFEYKGNKCDLGDFMRIGEDAPEWMKEFDGYSPDSAFSGLLIKLCDDNDTLKVYTYISLS